jgi:hypothetical protein
MACEKYYGWMTEAALGELRPERESELLAHVAECDVCRKAYSHTKAVAAAADRGVERLVAGEPSPQFAARLRAQLAGEPIPARGNWSLWVPTMVGAAAVFVLLMIVLTRSPHSNSPNAGTLEPNQAPLASNATEGPPQPVPASRARIGHSIHTATHRQARPREPEVLVPPGQLEAALQFADAIRTGRVNGAQVLAAQQMLDKLLEPETSETPQRGAPEDDDSTDILRPSGLR